MRLRVLLLSVAVPFLAGSARAEAPAPSRTTEKPVAPFDSKSGYMQFLVTAMGGVGFRFDNPYRLATPLGDDAESVSRTSSYLDFGLTALVFGNPLRIQHGFSLRMSIALEGVSQTVFTPSYLVWYRRGAWAGFGRAGLPIVASPDTTWGLEAAGGAAWFFRGGLGAMAELVGDVFYGAGTADAGRTTYPVLSAQLGLIGSYEVLP